jgi:hypothetical protein
MQRGTRHVLVVAIWMILFFSPHSLAGDLDQSQTWSKGPGAILFGDQFLAQTFTPSVSGQLESVWLMVAGGSSGLYHPSLSIVTTNDGVPDGQVLGTANDLTFLPYGDDGFRWRVISLVALNVKLQAGQLYGIVLHSQDTDAQSPNDVVSVARHQYIEPYERGMLWLNDLAGAGWEPFPSPFPADDSDLTFQTFMVPEPVTPTFCGLGVTLLLSRRRR